MSIPLGLSTASSHSSSYKMESSPSWAGYSGASSSSRTVMTSPDFTGKLVCWGIPLTRKASFHFSRFTSVAESFRSWRRKEESFPSRWAVKCSSMVIRGWQRFARQGWSQSFRWCEWSHPTHWDYGESCHRWRFPGGGRRLHSR